MYADDVNRIWTVPQMTFSEAEMEKLRRFAAWRNDPKLDTVPNHKISDQHGDYEVHLIGVMGEYAAAKYTREPFDLFIDLGGDNNGADLYIGPFTSQVRCSFYTPPYLKFNSLEEFWQDIAILGTRPKDNAIRLHGWIKREHFMKRYWTKDFGKGERFCVGQPDLYEMVLLRSLTDYWRKKGV